MGGIINREWDSPGIMSAALASHHHTDLHSHHPQQLVHHNINITTMHPQEDLNFSTFMDLCRFCSLRPGQKMNVFDKEAEQRQVLYKVRSVLPSVVSHMLSCWLFNLTNFSSILDFQG